MFIPIMWENIFCKLPKSDSRIWNRKCEGFVVIVLFSAWIGIQLKMTARIIFKRAFAFSYPTVAVAEHQMSRLVQKFHKCCESIA